MLSIFISVVFKPNWLYCKNFDPTYLLTYTVSHGIGAALSNELAAILPLSILIKFNINHFSFRVIFL